MCLVDNRLFKPYIILHDIFPVKSKSLESDRVEETELCREGGDDMLSGWGLFLEGTEEEVFSASDMDVAGS